MKSQFEHHPGFLIYDSTRLFRQVFGARLQDLDLSESRWRVLGTLSRFSGISQTQLAQHLAIGRAPLGELVTRLEREGLLERRPNPNDSRAKQLFITPGANPLVSEILKRLEVFKREIFKGLTAQRLQELERILIVFYRNLLQMGEGPEAELPVDDMSFLHLLSCSSRLSRRRFDEQLKTLGFTRAQWLVLAGIQRQEGVQQNILAQSLNISKAPLGVLVDTLERNQWVERKPHPQDRRAKQLFLSATCKNQLQDLGDFFEELYQATLVGISAPDRKKLVTGLTLVRSNLQTLASAEAALHHTE